jgi:hypothetical protein
VCYLQSLTGHFQGQPWPLKIPSYVAKRYQSLGYSLVKRATLTAFSPASSQDILKRNTVVGGIDPSQPCGKPYWRDDGMTVPAGLGILADS